MVFRMGREVVHGEPDAVHHDKETIYNSLNVQRLGKLNLEPQDYVALMGGIHTLGFKGELKKGP